MPNVAALEPSPLKLRYLKIFPILVENITNMKRPLKTLLILLILSHTALAHRAAVVQDSATLTTITHLHAEIRKQYVQDGRTAIFEFSPHYYANDRHAIFTTESDAAAQFERELARQQLTDHVRITVMPDSTMGDHTKGVVQLSVANLRTQPRNQAEMATQLLLGTQVDLLYRQGNNYRVRTPEGYIAWAPISAITPMTVEDAAAWNRSNRVIFIDDHGYAYHKADDQSQRISDLVLGNILQAGKTENGYTAITYPDGRAGFVKQDQTQPFDQWLTTRTLVPDNVLAVAKSMIGVPYLWGGTSNKGLDCSGFTKTAYFMNGLIIPRDASQQVLTGTPVDVLTNGKTDPSKILTNLQPADLLFFAEAKEDNPNARITHVAIYMGNGEFIHASGTVRINSFLPDADNYDDHQNSTLVSARRYVGHESDALQSVRSHPAYIATTSQ